MDAPVIADGVSCRYANEDANGWAGEKQSGEGSGSGVMRGDGIESRVPPPEGARKPQEGPA